MKNGFLTGLFVWAICLLNAQPQVRIIPKPVSLQQQEGVFLFDKSVQVQAPVARKDVMGVVNYFTNAVKQVSGNTLPVKTAVSGKTIRFHIEPTADVGTEGYRLLVTPAYIEIRAGKPAGLFYAVQSLLQTLPAIRTNQVLQIPCMTITDAPRFKWRGMMLDVSRHFFSPELVKEFIDLLASYKMNTFHWHLADGAGWRIEIKKYPKLTGLAAWRVDDWGKSWDWSQVRFNADRSKATYGGFYTQEQVKEIVAYAAARQVTIVPEIEMPGHSEAAMAAYPEYSCLPHKHSFQESGDFYGKDVHPNYCAGNDSAFIFLQNILKEVMALFPSQYIHVGGDEVDKTSWKQCARCQQRMKTEGLKNEEELQSYFIHRMEKFLIAHQRKLIGWDEILEGGLAPQATVMSWRGESGGIKAAQMNHDVVMSPTGPLYFDYYQGDPETEPLAFGGFNTLKRVYNYEPIPAALNKSQAAHILGAQANLWTEQISSHEHVEYMILPRMPALAEVLWSAKESRNWSDFNQRLQPHLEGFEQRGLRYSKGNFKVDINPQVVNGKLLVSLETENEEGVIYYTTDGTEPGTGSPRYEKPFEVKGSITVKAALAIHNSMVRGRPAQQSFTLNKATGRPLQYATPYSKYYPANGPFTLVDGIRGTTDAGKQWHAFNGTDLVATVDLGLRTTAGSITLGCLQHYGQWIFFPQWVTFEVSDDGKQFTEIAMVRNTVPVADKAPQTKDFTARFDPRSFRYVRVTAKNLGQCPKGHPGEGQAAWLFCDEITVE
ncbi:family 20 glycosylhydrolase [Niabella pedocola]|uniref:beta-N-acetylhexosaminidase n=1 Tax=Niabella pedocola TaxID=1752077 RepID=A0ABS8PL62_9BACT|nr:family 20 glycosylhydrolase [Niabella pedocola]MCD2421843.1 family 20 glycosylhydrolase [Niabella pedocola]